MALDWEEGPVAVRLRRPLWVSPLVEIERERALLRLPTIGRLMVPSEGPVTVAAQPGADRDDIEALLAGPGTALRALLQRRFALRASAALVDGKAVVVAGSAAVGKSTVVASLLRQGGGVLADGAAVIDAGDPPTMRPTAQRIALWPAAVEAVGFEPADGRPLRRSLAARCFAGAPVPDAAAPVGRIVILTMGTAEGALVERVVPGLPAVMERLSALGWFGDAIVALGLVREHFAWLTSLASLQPIVVRRSTTVASYEATFEESLR